MCNQSNWRPDVRCGDVMTRMLKSTWCAASASFLSFSKALCVYQSIVFCESVTIKIGNRKFILKKDRQRRLEADISKANEGESRSRYRLCVPPCPRYNTSGIHTVFAMIWLGGENSLWGGSFHLRPRSTCHAAAEAEQWLCSQLD